MKSLTKNYINKSQAASSLLGNSWKMDSSVQSSPVRSHSCSWPKPHVSVVKVAVTFLPSVVQEMSWQMLHPSQKHWEVLTALCWAIPWDWGELTEWLSLAGRSCRLWMEPQSIYVCCLQSSWLGKPLAAGMKWSKIFGSMLLTGMSKALYGGEVVCHLCPL